VVLLNKLPKCYLHWRLVKTTASGNAIFAGGSLNQLLVECGSKTTASGNSTVPSTSGTKNAGANYSRIVIIELLCISDSYGMLLLEPI
jgi:hypothetical protein